MSLQSLVNEKMRMMTKGRVDMSSLSLSNTKAKTSTHKPQTLNPLPLPTFSISFLQRNDGKGAYHRLQESIRLILQLPMNEDEDGLSDIEDFGKGPQDKSNIDLGGVDEESGSEFELELDLGLELKSPKIPKTISFQNFKTSPSPTAEKLQATKRSSKCLDLPDGKIGSLIRKMPRKENYLSSTPEAMVAIAKFVKAQNKKKSKRHYFKSTKEADVIVQSWLRTKVSEQSEQN